MSNYIKSSPSTDQLLSYPSGDKLGSGPANVAGAIVMGAMQVSSKFLKQVNRVFLPPIDLNASVVSSRSTTSTVSLMPITVSSQVKVSRKAQSAPSLPAITIRTTTSLYRMREFTSILNNPALAVGSALFVPPPAREIAGVVNLPSLTMRGRAQVHRLFDSEAAITLPHITSSGPIDLNHFIAGDITNPAMVVSASTEVVKTAQGVLSLPVMEQASAAIVGRVSVGGVALPVLSLSGDMGLLRFIRAPAAVSLPSMVLVSSAIREPVAAGILIMPGLGVYAMVNGTKHATGPVTLPAMTVRGAIDNRTDSDYQYYTVTDIKVLAGTPYKIVTLVPTRKPIPT